MIREAFVFSILSLVLPLAVRAAASDIVINEIAAYETSGCEWLEIYNKGSAPVNLQGWKFWENSTNHGLKVASTSAQTDWQIEPNEYAIIAQDANKLFSSACGARYAPPAGTVFDSSWGTLNEQGEAVGLKDAGGAFAEQFTYVPAPRFSLERKNAALSDYTSANWQEHISGNSFGRKNELPSAPAPVSAPPVSPPSHQGGPATVIIPSPTPASTPLPAPVVIPSPITTQPTPTPTQTPVPTPISTPVTTPASPVAQLGGPASSPPSVGLVAVAEPNIVINEFVANPAVGEHEWVELYNKESVAVDLSGWKLEDGQGVFAALTGNLPPRGFLVVEILGSRLNNDGDRIALKHLSNTVDSAAYGNSQPGKSFARAADGVNFLETVAITKGRENAAPIVSDSQTVSGSTVPDFTLGKTVQVTGIVTALPGTISKQSFFISFAHNESIQVYLHNQQFPALKLGDSVSVTGMIALLRGEKKIKVKQGEDIVVNGHGAGSAPAVVTPIVNLARSAPGQLVQVQGEITERASNHLYIDDGGGEVKVELKKFLGRQDWKLGDTVRAAGIEVRTKKGERKIVPRRGADISAVASATSSSAEALMADSTTLDLPAAKKYLTVTAGGLASLLAGMLLQARGGVMLLGIKKAGMSALRALRRKKGE